MSHIVTVSTKIKDTQRLQRVCQAKSMACEIAAEGATLTRRVYETDVKGVAAVTLPGWRYPAVVGNDGTVKYDNYRGSWGNQQDLDGLVQEYAKETVLDEALAQGYRVESQHTEQDGTIELVLSE